MKNHVLARSVGSQYGNQFNIAFRCENLHSFLAKFILFCSVLRSVSQFVSRSRYLKMSRFPKSSLNRLRISSIGNSFVILCADQIETSTSPPPQGKPRAFDYLLRPRSGEFDLNLGGVGKIEPEVSGFK